jgi:hypothetical protein
MLTSAQRQDMLAKIQRLPAAVEGAVQGLNERQLETLSRIHVQHGENHLEQIADLRAEQGWSEDCRDVGCLNDVADDPGSHCSPQ